MTKNYFGLEINLERDENLNDFGVTFNYSKLGTAIDNADDIKKAKVGVGGSRLAKLIQYKNAKI